MKEVRIGVISFAHFHGYSYARCVAELPNAKLVAVADDDEARGRKVAEQYSVDFHQDYRKLLSREDVDAVIVRRMVKVPLILAGGIRSVTELKRLDDIGVDGAILGKALYEGVINLREAVSKLRDC